MEKDKKINISGALIHNLFIIIMGYYLSVLKIIWCEGKQHAKKKEVRREHQI